jgi:hypothetical protein
MVRWSQNYNQWIQGTHTTINNWTIGLTCNNGKPMAIVPLKTVYHVIRCTLIFQVFYMHAFTTHHFIIFVNHNRFHKWSSQLSINKHFMRVVNMHVLYIKNSHAMRKITITSICVSLLTCVVRINQIVFQRISNFRI